MDLGLFRGSKSFMMKKRYTLYSLIFSTKSVGLEKIYIVTQSDLSVKDTGYSMSHVQM